MFPLKTTERVETWSVVTWLLIAVNVYVFVHHNGLSGDAGGFVKLWGLVPKNYPNLFNPAEAEFDPRLIFPFFTSMFLHGGLLHLLGNALSLWVFGPNIEDRLGHFGFLIFYFACGLAAGVTQIAFSNHSEIPMIGASGAIAGVMGAFFLLYPGARVISVVPIFVFPLIVRVPAFFYLFFWIGMNVISALKEIQIARFNAAGVAWWAHIGGFGIGLVLALVLKKTKPAKPEKAQ